MNLYAAMSDQLAEDIQQLDDMDDKIERLLKKRQSKYFTDEDKVRLQDLIDAREAIEVKYNLTPADTDGFDKIQQKVQAEVARAQARGQTVDTSVYQDAMAAAAEGLATVNQQIDDQYDKEYALIQLITDSTERQEAMDRLNAKYNEDRQAAAEEYAETLASVVMPVWDSEEMPSTDKAVDDLYSKLREYSLAGENNDFLGMAQAPKDKLIDRGLCETEISGGNSITSPG